MYIEKEVVYIKAMTPIHAGTGQSLTSVDMPIQRERHSNIPKIEASSLKGAIKHKIRSKYDEGDDQLEILYTVFGPENGESHASSIGITDARLLFFPMRSATGIFKLITCPYVIKRWIDDIDKSERLSEYTKFLEVENGSCKILSDNEYLKTEGTIKVILEEYVFKCLKVDEELKSLFDSALNVDIDKVVILSDTDFADLVTMYTEVITRNKIDIKTGAAQGTGLFTEEYLPSETILYFSVLASPSFNQKNKLSAIESIKYFNENVGEIFQVGGNSTIGKGIVKRVRTLK